MSAEVHVGVAETLSLVERALMRAGIAQPAARSTARALVFAERDGQKGHGLSRVATYVEQVRCRKVRADAIAVARRVSPVAIQIDAAYGFAYPAIDLAIEELVPMARKSAVAVAAIARSHHFGQAGAHVERLAEAGLVGLLFGNSPKAMAFWGGKRPMIGTNPIAFAAPLPDGPPLVIDLAVSVAARGKILAANKSGQTIPPDWAFDDQGKPTTDAAAALKGSMAPAGGAKGAALALMIEIIAAAVTGSHFGFEASSFLDTEGSPPGVGQVMIAIEPNALSSGAYLARMATLLHAMAEEPNVRQPGSSRIESRRRAAEKGLSVSTRLLAEIRALAGDAA